MHGGVGNGWIHVCKDVWVCMSLYAYAYIDSDVFGISKGVDVNFYKKQH